MLFGWDHRDVLVSIASSEKKVALIGKIIQIMTA